MHNLFRMSSLASLEGHYFKPRMDRELLATYGEGLIATTGCPSRRGADPAAPGAVRPRRWRRPRSSSDIFGAGNYYCELMDHGLRSSGRSARTCCGWPRSSPCRWSRPTTCTTPAPRTPTAHAALLCVQSGSTLADPNRFKFDADDFYLKTAEEMRARLPRAARGVRQHAARSPSGARSSFEQGEGRYMPRVRLPGGRGRAVLVRQGGRARPAARATPTACPDYAPQAGRVRDRRHPAARATRATSWSSPTSSTGPRTTASGSARAAGPAPARCAPTRCGSPTSTRSSTA